LGDPQGMLAAAGQRPNFVGAKPALLPD
jgi:hypothetical protein